MHTSKSSTYPVVSLQRRHLHAPSPPPSLPLPPPERNRCRDLEGIPSPPGRTRKSSKRRLNVRDVFTESQGMAGVTAPLSIIRAPQLSRNPGNKGYRTAGRKKPWSPSHPCPPLPGQENIPIDKAPSITIARKPHIVPSTTLPSPNDRVSKLSVRKKAVPAILTPSETRTKAGTIIPPPPRPPLSTRRAQPYKAQQAQLTAETLGIGVGSPLEKVHPDGYEEREMRPEQEPFSEMPGVSPYTDAPLHSPSLPPTELTSPAPPTVARSARGSKFMEEELLERASLSLSEAYDVTLLEIDTPWASKSQRNKAGEEGVEKPRRRKRGVSIATLRSAHSRSLESLQQEAPRWPASIPPASGPRATNGVGLSTSLTRSDSDGSHLTIPTPPLPPTMPGNNLHWETGEESSISYLALPDSVHPAAIQQNTFIASSSPSQEETLLRENQENPDTLQKTASHMDTGYQSASSTPLSPKTLLTHSAPSATPIDCDPEPQGKVPGHEMGGTLPRTLPLSLVLANRARQEGLLQTDEEESVGSHGEDPLLTLDQHPPLRKNVLSSPAHQSGPHVQSEKYHTDSSSPHLSPRPSHIPLRGRINRSMGEDEETLHPQNNDNNDKKKKKKTTLKLKEGEKENGKKRNRFWWQDVLVVVSSTGAGGLR